jgi:hypothetical protein
MVAPRSPLPLCRRSWGFSHSRPLILPTGHRSCLHLFPPQLLPSVVNLQPPIFPLAHPHLDLRRRVVLALPLHLIEPVLMPHHPVVAQYPLRFQPENLL